MSLEISDKKKISKIEKYKKEMKELKFCPNCGSKDLIPFDVDVLCGHCDWNSFEQYVNVGGMDHLGKAYLDHFVTPLTDKSIKSDKILAKPHSEVDIEEL